MTNGIQPTTALWWNFGFLLLTGAAAGSVSFAGIPDQYVSIIKAWAADGAFAITCANLVFHWFSSTAAGPGTTTK